MDRWRDFPGVRVTVVCLVGSGALVAAGTAGVAGSPWLVVALGGLAAGLWLLGRAATDTAWRTVDPHCFVADLWLGPVVAAVIATAFLEASPGEVQAIGGLVGLAGMVNYFLRPVYYALYGLVARRSGQ